ncbi:MAG: hypothetical protein WD057_19480 [Aquisalimonadaceae bacterium]
MEAADRFLEKGERCTVLVLKKTAGARETVEAARRLPGLEGAEFVAIDASQVTSRRGPARAVRALWHNRRLIQGPVRRYCEDARILFLGNLMNRELLAAAQLAKSDIVILDDGTSTAAFFEAAGDGDRLQPAPRAGNALSGKCKEAAFRFFYGAASLPKSRIILFTTYPESSAGMNCRVVSNEFRVCRRLVAAGRTLPEAHFLGAPFVERGQLDWKEYAHWLIEAYAHLGRDVRYIAHWAESPEKLRQVEHLLGWETVRFALPYEMQFVLDGARPRIVAGCFSSAFDILPRFFAPGTGLQAFEIPVERIRSAAIQSAARSFYRRHRDTASPVDIITIQQAAPGRQSVRR